MAIPSPAIFIGRPSLVECLDDEIKPFIRGESSNGEVIFVFGMSDIEILNIHIGMYHG